MIGREKLISPEQKDGAIFVYANGSLIRSLNFPVGTIYFPPTHNFTDGDRIRVRIEYADGEWLSDFRKILMLYRDGHQRKMSLIIPGEPERFFVEPDGHWETYYFNQQAIGYGPLEMIFKIISPIMWRKIPFCDALPWMVE